MWMTWKIRQLSAKLPQMAITGIFLVSVWLPFGTGAFAERD